MKKMKNKIFFVIVSFIFFNCFCNVDFCSDINAKTPSFCTMNQAYAQENAKTNNNSSPKKGVNSVKKSQNKIERTKPNKGIKFILKKFLLTMFLVVVSAGIIFVALLLYKKLSTKNTHNSNSEKSLSLQTPKNFKDTINLFLDKTRD